MGGHRYASRPGPKPRKNAMKTLTAGAVSFIANDDLQPPASLPSCPAWLSPAAKTEFYRMLLEFKTVDGWVTRADRTVLASYCQHYASWKDAAQHVAIDGAVIQALNVHGLDIGTKVNPWQTVAAQESALCVKFANMLGLSPGARSTLHVTPKRAGLDPLMPPAPHRPDQFTPPKSKPPHMRVEHKKSRTKQPDPPDPIVEIQPDQVVEVQPDPVEQDPVVRQDINPVVPVTNAESSPTETRQSPPLHWSDKAGKA